MKTYSLKGILIILVVHISCNSYSPKAYIQYIKNPENGLTRNYTSKDYSYSLSFKPIELMAYQEWINNNKNVPYDSIFNQYIGLEYYGLDIKSLNPSNKKDSLSNQYKSFSFEHNIRLALGDSLRPALFHYENTSGLKPAEHYEIAFEVNPGNTKDRIFMIHSYLIDNNIKLIIKHEDIQSIPKLKI